MKTILSRCWSSSSWSIGLVQFQSKAQQDFPWSLISWLQCLYGRIWPKSNQNLFETESQRKGPRASRYWDWIGTWLKAGLIWLCLSSSARNSKLLLQDVNLEGSSLGSWWQPFYDSEKRSWLRMPFTEANVSPKVRKKEKSFRTSPKTSSTSRFSVIQYKQTNKIPFWLKQVWIVFQ